MPAKKTAGRIQRSRFRTLDLAYIALFAVLMSVCAWISTPKTPISVPFTLQTFALFATLTILGGRRGLWAVLVYLLMGLAGLPVFSGFQGGPGVLLGATGGYIIGFIGSALIYWLTTAKLGSSLPAAAFACVLGMSVYYAFGTAWFLALYTSTRGAISLISALTACVFPFVLPDLAKIALAVLLSRRVGKYLK